MHLTIYCWTSVRIFLKLAPRWSPERFPKHLLGSAKMSICGNKAAARVFQGWLGRCQGWPGLPGHSKPNIPLQDAPLYRCIPPCDRKSDHLREGHGSLSTRGFEPKPGWERGARGHTDKRGTCICYSLKRTRGLLSLRFVCVLAWATV